jgi:hypothetical protein
MDSQTAQNGMDGRRRFPPSRACRAAVAAALIAVAAPRAAPAIVVGAGPAIGTDVKGVTWYQEFQDWGNADLRALDTNDDEYKFNNYADPGCDIVAFYSHDDGTNVYLRVDLFDLGYGWENNEVDVYVAIDCAPGGQPWLPDYTDCTTDHPWEACVGVYNASAGVVYDDGWTNHPSDYLGSYWRADLDGVEFGIKRSLLTSKGWNGSSPLHFQPFTCRDGTFNGQGEIDGQASDLVDGFGAFIRGASASNGWYLGGVSGTATTSRAKYAVIAHANQSLNEVDGIQWHLFTDYSADLKPGQIRLLDTAEMLEIPVNLHLSGTMLMALQWARQNPSEGGANGYPRRDGPTFLRRVSNFVTNGPGALIGGVLAEHIMPYFEGPVNEKSIQQNTELIQRLFGLSPGNMMVMHTPERVIRSQTNHAHVSSSGPLDGKTFEDIGSSGYSATYLDEVTHLHWWFYPGETNNPGWDDYNYGRWAGGMGNDEEPYHHKLHKVNGVYCFMINDREDQSKFGNNDGGMMNDTRYTLLQKARGDYAQLTLVFDDWEAYAGNSFASLGQPNNNADQIHNTLRWAANHPWIEFVTLKQVLQWATNDPNWVVDHGYVYDQSSQTYEWLKRASEHDYDHWYYGSGQEESFFDRVPVVHNNWSPSGMKTYGDLNTTNTILRDAWDRVEQTGSTALRKLAEWSYSAMIYETAWHDEDANPDQYKSRNYQVTFNRGVAQGNYDESYEDTTWDDTSDWALKLQGHVRDLGVFREAGEWVQNVRNGVQGATTLAYAKDLDDDTMDEYVLCNNRVFACFERWGARLIKVFVYDPALNGGDAREVVGAPAANPPSESDEEFINEGRCSAFKEQYSTGLASSIYVDKDFGAAPVQGAGYWEFASDDGGKVWKRYTLENGRDVVRAEYRTDPSVGRLYTRHGLGPDQMDLMLSGQNNLAKVSDASFAGLRNTQGGEAYVVLGGNATFSTGALVEAGWDNRNAPLVEQLETYNNDSATNYRIALAFSEGSARDLDADGLQNTNEWAIGTDHERSDTDEDRMPDGYEVESGLNPTNAADAGLDKDGDLVLNWEECVANTRANDPSSYFHIPEIVTGPGAAEIRHTTASGRQYAVFYSDDAWHEISNWQAFNNTNAPFGSFFESGAGGTHSFTDDYSSATTGHQPTNRLRFYRVRVTGP